MFCVKLIALFFTLSAVTEYITKSFGIIVADSVPVLAQIVNDGVQFEQQCFLITKEQTAPHIFVQLCDTGKIHKTACRETVCIE